MPVQTRNEQQFVADVELVLKVGLQQKMEAAIVEAIAPSMGGEVEHTIEMVEVKHIGVHPIANDVARA